MRNYGIAEVSMKRLTRLWIWLPGLLLVFAVGIGLAAGAVQPSAWAANASGESTPAVSGTAIDKTEVQEQIIDGECELVDANGVPLYDAQFEQRTGSSPCDQH